MKGFNPISKLFSKPTITTRAPKAEKASFIQIKDVSSVPGPRVTVPKATLTRVVDNAGLNQDIAEKHAIMARANAEPPVWYIPNFSTQGSVGKITDITDRPVGATTAEEREASFRAAVDKGAADMETRDLARQDSSYKNVMDTVVAEALRRQLADDKHNALIDEENERAFDREEERLLSDERQRQLDAADAALKDAETEAENAITAFSAENKKGGRKNRPAITAAHARVTAAREKINEIQARKAKLTSKIVVSNTWKDFSKRLGESERNRRLAYVRRTRELVAAQLRAKTDAAYARHTAPRRPGTAAAGPSGAGPSGAGPSGAGPSGARPSGAGPSGAGPSNARTALRAAAAAGLQAAEWDLPGGRAAGPSGSRPGTAPGGPAAGSAAGAFDLETFSDVTGFDTEESEFLKDQGISAQKDSRNRVLFYQARPGEAKRQIPRSEVMKYLSSDYVPEEIVYPSGTSPPPQKGVARRR